MLDNFRSNYRDDLRFQMLVGHSESDRFKAVDVDACDLRRWAVIIFFTPPVNVGLFMPAERAESG